MIVTNIKELCRPCKTVSLEKGLIIASHLLEEIVEHDALGLAANQIGYNARVFLALNPKTSMFNVYINPILVSKSEKMIFQEGCISFPGENVETVRYNQIVVKDFIDDKERTLTGLEAIIFQHELDHLDGITMFERNPLGFTKSPYSWAD